MNSRIFPQAALLGLVLVGCNKPYAGLKRDVPQTVPSGWAKSDLKGVNYSFCTPKTLKPQLAPPEVLASATQGVKGGEALKSLVICTSTNVPPDMVAVFEEAELKTNGELKDFMTGFKNSLVKQGILTTAATETVEKTPIGDATVVKSAGKIAGQASQTTIYVWADKSSVFSMMVSGIGKDPDDTAKKIAETFRVAGS